VFSFPPRFLDLHRGRAGLVPSDAAASLARRKPRRATQNDASDAWTRRDSRTRRVRSDIRAVGSGRSGGFVRLSPLPRVRPLRRLAGLAGFVRFVGFVRIPGAAGFVRMFAPSGPVGPVGSFGFRLSWGSFAANSGWAGFVRPIGFVRMPGPPGSFECSRRRVRSPRWVRLDRATRGSVRSAAPSAALGSFAPLGWFGFLSCRVRSKRAHVIEPAKELAWRRTASPGPARHRPTRCKARPLIISALPLWACRRGGQTERGRCDHSVADRRKKFQR
jgi:hypothetical protein